MRPMLYESAEMDDLPALAGDEQVVLEQKCDGVRVLAEITRRSGVRFTGAGGEPIRYPAAAQWLDRLSAELEVHGPVTVTLDGELMIEDGTYVVFDMPYLRFGDTALVTPNYTLLAERRRLLELIAPEMGLRLVSQARTPAEKIALVREVGEVLHGEGFMLKRLDSPYQPGVRVSHSVKCKFVHTADVIVVSWERTATTGSARLAVYNDEGGLVPVGGCSLIGKPAVHDRAVIEVAYANFRGAMIQPRMMRVRPDKDPMACRLSQFGSYSKAVL